jgi:glucokinase
MLAVPAVAGSPGARISSILHMKKLFIGVDVGGTKLLAAIIDSRGAIYQSKKVATPRGKSGNAVARAIAELINALIKENGLSVHSIYGIGLAIPGVVDTESGMVILTPNMSLSGIAIGPFLEKHCTIPVFIENDVNLGTLGETWLGGARKAHIAVGIFVGTGIGAGIVINGRLHSGYRHAAGEIGHMVMQPHGLLCGCGNRGCLETFSSRTAIERAIREAVVSGRKSVVKKLTGGDMSVIKSGVLKRALKQEDELVTEVMTTAAETLGYACLSVRHLLDPDAIILGGGVLEACGDFMIPIVEQIVNLHSLPGTKEKNVIVSSVLGDNAVILGAAALVRNMVRQKKQHEIPDIDEPVSYPQLTCKAGTIHMDGNLADHSFSIDGHGITKPVVIKAKKEEPASGAYIRGKTVRTACAGLPDLLVISAQAIDEVKISPKALAYIDQQGIELKITPHRRLASVFNKSTVPRAAIVVV